MFLKIDGEPGEAKTTREGQQQQQGQRTYESTRRPATIGDFDVSSTTFEDIRHLFDLKEWGPKTKKPPARFPPAVD
jgi:hypothetical protein